MKNRQTKALQKKPREAELAGLYIALANTTGLPSKAAVRLVAQMCSALIHPRPKDDTEAIIAAITALQQHAPRNVVEAGLAAQMTATSEMALMFLERAILPAQTPEGVDRNVLRASRLMRLHLEQIEAMQKLKGKTGQQKVTVEHVHVHDGGQAIVGAVRAISKAEGGGGERR